MADQLSDAICVGLKKRLVCLATGDSAKAQQVSTGSDIVRQQLDNAT
jgi:hypothetical protein